MKACVELCESEDVVTQNVTFMAFTDVRYIHMKPSSCQVTIPCMLWGFGTAIGELHLGLS